MPAENLNLDPATYAFLDSCLYDKGIKDIDEDLKAQMIQDLAVRLQDWLIQAIMKYLDTKQVKEVEKLLEQKASQEILMSFLASKIPNLNKIFDAEMAEFKKAYISAG